MSRPQTSCQCIPLNLWNAARARSHFTCSTTLKHCIRRRLFIFAVKAPISSVTGITMTKASMRCIMHSNCGLVHVSVRMRHYARLGRPVFVRVDRKYHLNHSFKAGCLFFHTGHSFAIRHRFGLALLGHRFIHRRASKH